MYKPPYNKEELKEKCPEIVDKLLADPVHKWRAETGIELIHKEPDLEEQRRIWDNWQEMNDEQKKISDAKSMELFGMDNANHNRKIMK